VAPLYATATGRPRAVRLRSGSAAQVDVVHVLPHAHTLGGSERAVLDLLESPELEDVRQRVAFVQAGPAVSFPAELVLGVKSHLWHPLAAARAIARIRPCVIHGWLLQGNLVGALAQLMSPSSGLLSSERNVGDALTPAKRALERIVAARETLATANSEAVRLAALQRLPRRAGAMRLIPPGVAPPRPPGEVATTTVVMVGRLDPVKDHASALRAWSELVREDPSLRLTIVGDGAERDALEALGRSLGVRETISFAGDVDPRPHLFGARAYLQSSRAEGFSRSLLEALMVGLPAVVTDVGGVRELCAGVLDIVDPEDSVALACALRRVLADAQALQRARRDAQLVAAQFEPTRCARSYRELYRELGVA
jgi:glycosyltransferase involved in cell wall biosynthesis